MMKIVFWLNVRLHFVPQTWKETMPTHHLIALFLALFAFTGVVGQEETQCRGHDVNLSTEQRTQITDCLKESGISSIWKIPAEKLACFGVCILEKKKLLTADGKLDKPKILDYIELIMRPEEVKVPLKEGISKCMDEHGDKVKGGWPVCPRRLFGYLYRGLKSHPDDNPRDGVAILKNVLFYFIVSCQLQLVCTKLNIFVIENI